MWQFDYPWVFLLLPLAWLAYRYLPEYREARSALRVPFFHAVSHALGQKPGRAGRRGERWQGLLNLLVWGLVIAACARPVFIEPATEREQPIRDLMLAIDISQSMETTDYTNASGERVDRLSAVKDVVRDFVAQRQHDRIGLVVFGSGAYPQAPLTLDHDSLGVLLDEIGIGMAGPNTALGDAIGLTIKLLSDSKEREKLLILLTDGNDTGSAITPDHAARMARDSGLKIHTIGIGDPQASGDARVDLQVLNDIATTTGGRFFQAQDRQALQAVYATLNQLTPHTVKTLRHQPKRDLFWWPLAGALVLLALSHSIAALHGARPAPKATRSEAAR